MIGKAGQSGLAAVDQSILGQPPRFLEQALPLQIDQVLRRNFSDLKMLVDRFVEVIHSRTDWTADAFRAMLLN